MSETIQVALISALSAIIGAALGYFASAIQAAREFERHKSLDATKRRWQLEDEQREYRRSIRTRRLDQAEEFIGYVTEDFQSIRHAAIFIVQCEDPQAIEQKIHEYGHWRDTLPKRVYAFGASVRSMSSPALVTAWDSLNSSFEQLTETYKRICADKERGPSRHPQGLDLLKQIDTLYEGFNQGLGAFIAELDRLRADS